MKIYTKKGDDGTTGLIGGTRVPKYHLRIEAYGTVDELNSWIGVLRDQPGTETDQSLLQEIQDRLFTLGSALACDPEKSKMAIPDLKDSDVSALEQSIDAMESELPPLQNFVLPGGHLSNSFAHLARCVCRRAERLVVELAAQAPVEPLILRYLNRLSDWLFVYSRLLSKRNQAAEIPWKPRG
ncbi:MAG: cob(I)yrinic acid a,c-diamide adenosyltransferase [Bacteroidia bacterium]|nr:cob(I)yrinic acid a,c-diamide adenosyltransferase [Bacteroidia bacterium]